MDKKIVWILLGVAVVGAGWVTLKGDGYMPGDLQASPTTSPSANAAKATPKPSVKGTPFNSATYSQYVQQYGNRRIQFDASCQASPKSVSVANNTSLMLDNRSGDARTVTVGGVAYALPGYGYTFVTAKSSTLPKTLTINCGSSVNVGTILVQ
jgi:hypothetical protein